MLKGDENMGNTLNIDPVKLNNAEMTLVDKVMESLEESKQKILDIKIDIPKPEFLKEKVQ